MKKHSLWIRGLTLALAFPATLSAAEVMDITTKDGTTIHDAMVETVNPDGIDVGYVDATGRYIFKSIPYQDLPDSLVKHFNIDPAQAQAHQQEVAKVNQNSVEALTQQQVEKCQAVLQEIRDKVSGNDPNIYIAPSDVAYVIFANRRVVQLHWVADTPAGTIAAVDEVTSGQPIDAKQIQLAGVSLNHDGKWTGFIYPSGLRTSFQGQELPVFADSVDKAYSLANSYVKMYLAYQADNAPTTPPAAQQPAPATAPQDQSSEAAYANQQVATADAEGAQIVANNVNGTLFPGGNAEGSTGVDGESSGGAPFYYPDDVNYVNYGYPYGYYVPGVSYRIPNWWIHNHFPPPYGPFPPHPGPGPHPLYQQPWNGENTDAQHYLLRPQGENIANQEIRGSGNFRQAQPASTGPRFQGGSYHGGGGFRR